MTRAIRWTQTSIEGIVGESHVARLLAKHCLHWASLVRTDSRLNFVVAETANARAIGCAIHTTGRRPIASVFLLVACESKSVRLSDSEVIK